MADTTSSHTPLPWVQHGSLVCSQGGWVIVSNRAKDKALNEANAAFIVRAVNSFDQMLHDLKLARDFGSKGETHEGKSVSNFIEQAIAKAEQTTTARTA